jgi:hypothetical protein
MIDILVLPFILLASFGDGQEDQWRQKHLLV